jgi:hypothetical protein
MRRLFLSGIFALMTLLTACNINTPNMTPTAEALIPDTPLPQIVHSPTPSQTPSLTPTNAVVEVPVVVSSPLPTQDLMPTEMMTPSATPGPCAETVQQGDTLTVILFRNPCGNEITQGLINAVVAINDNLFNPDILPALGSTILIPLPSPTLIPEGADMTETAQAEDGVIIIGSSRFVAGQEFGCYTVEEGDRILGIAELYNTSLEVLSQQNRNLNWSGCDFTNPSGGPNCNPNIRIGVCINVPLPTSTPIPTSTLSGRETATSTPTHEAAYVFYPPEGALVPQRITLEWVTVGILQSDEIYLLEVEDRTAGTSKSYVTYHTRFTLRDDMMPSDGQIHTIGWRVRVATINNNGSYTPIGGEGDWRSFQWQGQ